MQPRITLNHPKGDIQLLVTPPAGLVSDANARREEYGVVFISAARAQAIHDGMQAGNFAKLKFILDSHFSAHLYELPLLVDIGERFEVRNDAHVLAALVAAGLDPVPVVVHVDEAAALVA